VHESTLVVRMNPKIRCDLTKFRSASSYGTGGE